MIAHNARLLFAPLLHRIAPEIDLSNGGPHAAVQDARDLDGSLNLVTARFGTEQPSTYPSETTHTLEPSAASSPT